MAEGLEALLRSAQAALSAASATLPSAEERRAEAAAAESLAVSGAGAVAKTAVGVAGRLRRQWLRWLTEHGDAYTPFTEFTRRILCVWARGRGTRRRNLPSPKNGSSLLLSPGRRSEATAQLRPRGWYRPSVGA